MTTEATPDPYPWLTIHDDGSTEIDLEDTTIAEGDRRLIIAQEVQAGRLAVPKDS